MKKLNAFFKALFLAALTAVSFTALISCGTQTGTAVVIRLPGSEARYAYEASEIDHYEIMLYRSYTEEEQEAMEAEREKLREQGDIDIEKEWMEKYEKPIEKSGKPGEIISITDDDGLEARNYTININALDADGTYLGYSKTEKEITVVAGTTTKVNLTVELQEEESSKVVLYNKISSGQDPNVSETNYALYLFPKEFLGSDSQIEPDASYSQGSEFYDFVVDSTDSVYFITDSSLYMTTYDETKLLSEITIPPQSPSVYKDSKDVIFYGGDTGGDKIFMIGAFNMNNYTDYAWMSEPPDNPVAENSFSFTKEVDGKPELQYFNDFATELGEPEEEKNVTDTENYTTTKTYKGYLYLAGTASTTEYDEQQNATTTRDIVFVKVPFTFTSETIVENSEVSFTNTIKFNEETLDDEIETIWLSDYASGVASTLSDYSYISDITIHNGNIYALFKESGIDTSPSFVDDTMFQSEEFNFNINLRSRGAIIYAPTDFSKIYVRGDGSIMKANEDIKSLNTTATYGSSEEVTATFNISLWSSSTVLFGPTKFIAVKPKKLVIADDGIYYYVDDEGNLCFKNINKIVEYNEKNYETKSFTLSSTLPVYFESEETESLNISVSGTGNFNASLVITKKD